MKMLLITISLEPFDQSVGKDNFTAGTGTNAFFDDADICEDQFSGSPITAENNIIKQLAVIALGIINRLNWLIACLLTNFFRTFQYSIIK